jgi:hypothetical protein
VEQVVVAVVPGFAGCEERVAGYAGERMNGLGRLWLGRERVGVARLEGTQRALSETEGSCS